jgi:hypothetical protein
MFIVKVQLPSSIIEIHCPEKMIIGAALHGIYLTEVLGCLEFPVELFTLENGNKTLIGEYDSLQEFTKVFDIVPPVNEP